MTTRNGNISQCLGVRARVCVPTSFAANDVILSDAIGEIWHPEGHTAKLPITARDASMHSTFTLTRKKERRECII